MVETPSPIVWVKIPAGGRARSVERRSQTADRCASLQPVKRPSQGDHRAGVRTGTCHDIQTKSPWGCPSALTCSVASMRWPPTSAWTGPTPSTRPSLCWLEQEERKTTVRDRMLTIRALTKTDVDGCVTIMRSYDNYTNARVICPTTVRTSVGRSPSPHRVRDGGTSSPP